MTHDLLYIIWLAAFIGQTLNWVMMRKRAMRAERLLSAVPKLGSYSAIKKLLAVENVTHLAELGNLIVEEATKIGPKHPHFAGMIHTCEILRAIIEQKAPPELLKSFVGSGGQLYGTRVRVQGFSMPGETEH